MDSSTRPASDDVQLPSSLEAERALLGGLLLDPEQIPVFGQALVADDFYRSSHARLFQLLVDRSDQGQPIDLLAVTEAILGSGDPIEYGGVAYVAALPEKVPSTENLPHYADIVRDKAVRRRLVEAAQRIREAARSPAELPEILDAAERAVFEVSQERSQRDWHRLGTILDVEWLRIQELAGNPGEVTGVPTGFADLDRKLAGLQRSDLIILAARPAMGKTALALNIAQNVALKGNVGVGVFSLEMSRGQLTTRMLCTEARVDAGKVRTGFLTRDHELAELDKAAERLWRAPLWMVDTPGLTVNQVRSLSRRLKAEHEDLGLIVIDYLQLMQGSGGPRESREQAISSISRGLKGLAKELELPVIALSQLNRGVEARTDKRPMVSDLRESGAIEQDADIILFIYRDEYYNPDSPDKGVAEVIIAKHRSGPTGTVKLAFQGQFVRFDNLADRDGPGGYY